MARRLHNRDLPPWEGRSEFEGIVRHKRRESSLMQPHRAKRQRQQSWARRQVRGDRRRRAAGHTLPVDMDQFHEVTLALVDDRGGKVMPRKIHSPGVRKRPTPQPVKVKKPSK